jgi:CHAT domain-containing protein/tetratricopeptide (TPR) repeat protein
MPTVISLGRWLLALSLSFNLAFIAFSQPASSAPAAQNSSDQEALRALVEKYFALYASKDLDGLMGLWSEKSPDRSSLKQNLERQFATESYSLSHPTVSRVKAGEDKVSLRATARLTVIDLKNNQKRELQLARNFALVREERKWKVWRCSPAEEDLADALVKVESEAGRANLLAEEKELVTAELVRAMIEQGNRLYLQSRFDQSIAIYRLSQSVAEQIGDKAGIARALNNIGSIYNIQGDYAQALEYLQRSLATSEAGGDKAGIARALNTIGETELQRGDSMRALENFQKSLEASKALENNAGIARILRNIGEVYIRQGDYAQALEYTQKSLAIFEAEGNKSWIAGILNSIGIIHSSQGDYEQALEYFRKSLAVNDVIGEKGLIASVLINIGEVNRKQGDYAQALERNQKALSIFESIGYKVGIAGALDNIGAVHNLQGNYAQAVEYYQKSLAMRESLGNRAGIARSLGNIGAAYGSQGDHARALEYFQKSLAAGEPFGDKTDTANTLGNIGETYSDRADYAQALAYYQKSLAMRESTGDKNGIANSLFRIGGVYEKQGRHSLALDFNERATVLARQIGAADILRRALFNSGVVYRALNQVAKARQAFVEAIATIETLRAQIAGGEQERQRYFETKVSPYHAMVDLLIAEGHPAEALTFAERAKARVLLDVLQSGRVDGAKAMTGEEQEQERKLNSQLVSLNTQIYRETGRPQPDQARLTELNAQLQKARLDFEAFQINIYAAHPELKARRGETRPLRPEEAAALLPDAKSALLEYVVADDKTYLFVITKAAGKTEAVVRAYTAPIKRAELTSQIETFRRQLAGRDLGFRASAAKLYELLLKPAQAQLAGKKNLVIVPDDKLWEAPFQALLTGSHRFLMEEAALAYAPSLAVLREMTRRRSRNSDAASEDLLALGNPAIGQETVGLATMTLRGGKLDPLPEAEQEVKALGQLYSAERSKVYIGAEASEDRVKAEAGQARILHFATHGTLNNASPMYSYLALAQGDKNEDGLLEAWELMQMDLHADLAVLSACETARGRYGAGEGMIGLTWALFVAGVPSTVVSQWKVESASTRDLMLNFHRQLRAPAAAKAKVTKAEALRQAALKVMKNPGTSHPFYWAGFVLVGDGGGATPPQ